MKYTYQIEGMHCLACVKKIQVSLAAHFKIESISFDPPLLIIEAKKQPSLAVLNGALLSIGNYHLLPSPKNKALEKTTHTEAASPNTSQSVTPQVRHPERSEGSQIVQNSGDPSRKKHALRMTSAPLGYEDIETYPQPGELPQSYYPLYLIIMYIVGVTFINNIHGQGIHWLSWMNQFMAGFFLIFSAFKLLNIRGFAEGYATYDLLAHHWYPYGFIYPFLELGLGILYLTEAISTATQILTILIMGFSSLGVINSLRKKEKLRCSCLGTIINVPLSTITLVEDLGMVILAALALLGSQ